MRGRMTSYGERLIRLRQPMLSLLLLVCLSACTGQDVEDFKAAQVANSTEAYEAFIKKHPSSPLRRPAADFIDEPHFEEARALDTAEAWEKYLQWHPEGHHAAEAQDRLERSLYYSAVLSDERAPLETFLTRFPTSLFKQVVAKRLEQWALFSTVEVNVRGIEPTRVTEGVQGPRKGWQFLATLQNGSERTLKRVEVKLVILDGKGRVWDERQLLPVLPAHKEGERSYQKPLSPKQKRDFKYATARVPEDFNQQFRLYIHRIEE